MNRFVHGPNGVNPRGYRVIRPVFRTVRGTIFLSVQ